VFKYFFRKKTEEVLRRSSTQQSAGVPDSCKRAVGLFPETAGRRADEIKDTIALKFHHLLVSLEGAERTGCLKISSRYSKSRSALLLFRGRVVGAVYGCKSMRGQYLHQDAHKCALGDLAVPGNLLDAYELPEDLVLAAASLFYGETLDTNSGQTLESSFDFAVSSLQRSAAPGAVVVNSLKDETLCIVYIAGGRTVGIYSAADGWTNGSADTAKSYLRSGQCKLHAAILPSVDFKTIGFSLTGLGDRSLPALPVGQIDNIPYEDFNPSTSSTVRTPSREAVAEAVRQHRTTGEIPSAGRSFANVS
jgi:hypothetical protein